VEATLETGIASGTCNALRAEAKRGVQVLVFIRSTATSEGNRGAFGNKLFELLKTRTDQKAILLWAFSTCFSWSENGPCKHHLCCNTSLPLRSYGAVLLEMVIPCQPCCHQLSLGEVDEDVSSSAFLSGRSYHSGDVNFRHHMFSLQPSGLETFFIN